MDIFEPAPGNAVVLFNGVDMTGWHTWSGAAATWDVEDGILSCNGTGSIVSDEMFEDCRAHVEFYIPPEGPGNSGVYLQGRYEIQVLSHDYPDLPGTKHCGAIYNIHAPLVIVAQARETWQSFDIVFRAPRFDEAGEKTDSARITVLHNGVVVQNNVAIPAPTGGHVDEDVATPGGLMLQDHGSNPISFRNVWAEHLPGDGIE